MAVSFVQIGNNSGGAGNAVVTLASSTPTDNLLLAFWMWDQAATFSSIDDTVNAYTQLGTELTVGTTLRLRAYWAKNASAGIRTVTGAVTGGHTFNSLFIPQYSGQDLTNPIAASALVGHPAATANITDSLTLPGVNQVLVGFANALLGAISLVTGGYTNRSTASGATLDDLLHTTSGSKSLTWTDALFPAADDIGTIMVAIQPPVSLSPDDRRIYTLAPPPRRA